MNTREWRPGECAFCPTPPLAGSLFCHLHRQRVHAALRQPGRPYDRAKREAWQRYNRKRRAKGGSK